ncbi:ATP-dependent DNA helicase mph1 [Rhynchospora pubera]|uniref:ATP-dependent DNA helicase mph1 n=1 Tax=Rhynchospora pubera TaxID=906938 RepID=A0AAV8HN50_9POAL|nr:ATP-dependent DNA helicase mph1 [Rhynchospora pubera]
MASHNLPSDDDDFDWEAAVREIDSACEAVAAAASTSSRQPVDVSASTSATCPKPSCGKVGGKVRQSTLEKFVDSFTKRRKGEDGFVSPKVLETNLGVSDVQREENIGVEVEPQIPSVAIDPEAAKTWIYPINIPKREYQFYITKIALFTNTLVALPTGLGKTLIAAVVMFNYFRWFPEGKIIFAAPSRPLVVQQIEACHNIVGIPQEWTIYMTGATQPAKRSEYWKSKRVFFLTPQVLQKDIENGICLAKQIVCLVIDEAHRAHGNFSSCVAVRQLMSVPVSLRILALTATPGSKVPQIQDVINNLSISTLEYRDEDDPDVKPYVHNRELELVQVPLGEDANTINDLLLDVIRPHANFLGSFGLLYRRDISTFSPCEILTLKDKFKLAPPPNVPQGKHQEVDSAFYTLITLYHLKKLLSGHGIRPAYEMLVDKLKDRSFGGRMSKSETMAKIKLLMQRNLSHGAPFPKLTKMMDILTDHFKTKDPKDSRVIIFSNFRGSVKDIMDSLAKTGELVKATEFIGQSSGKGSKGQSQKTQQAVLQKFRSGGYNVIVATSIGEEGLDIMEVDLVICFDANISPLRMTQRMGRTGRKHDGRVVVLACEGSEIKGYRRKLEKSKAMKKHMRNASKSFEFHSSPRMIPHVYKPEVQFVELSIEEYIPQGGKRIKVGKAGRSSVIDKISNQERELIQKYFNDLGENTWKPSLIAFPGCQTLPSVIYKVHHSMRTAHMLIDTMQHLQGMPLSKLEPILNVESPSYCSESIPALRDFPIEPDNSELRSPVNFMEMSQPGKDISETISKTKYQAHHFLFGGENFMTVGLSGHVSLSAVPSFPFNLCSFLNNQPTVPNDLVITKTIVLNSPSGKLGQNGGMDLSPRLTHYEEGIVPIPKTETIVLDSPSDKSGENEGEKDLSPRLTHYMEEGIVPESPMVKSSTIPLNIDSSKAMVSQLKDIEVERNEKLYTPLANHTRESSSEDWRLMSGSGASSSVKRPPKYRRLRKLGELVKRRVCDGSEEECEGILNKKNRYGSGAILNEKQTDRGKKEKRTAFIEDEAEVSKDATVSDDEASEDEDKYEDSFIDDTTNLSERSTQAEPSGDMLAFYRRSLLTQSPMEALPRHCFSPHDSSRTSTSGSTEAHTPGPYQPPQNTHLESIDHNSVTRQSDSRRSSIVNRLTNNANNIQEEFANKLETRKRKLSFQRNYEPIPVSTEKPIEVLDYDDDDFYNSIDLDLVEAQAAELLRQKAKKSTAATEPPPVTNADANRVEMKDNMGSSHGPSFDLGF